MRVHDPDHVTHIAGNMLVLALLGAIVEPVLGHVRFAVRPLRPALHQRDAHVLALVLVDSGPFRPEASVLRQSALAVIVPGLFGLSFLRTLLPASTRAQALRRVRGFCRRPSSERLAEALEEESSAYLSDTGTEIALGEAFWRHTDAVQTSSL